ncbi:MULTISPECIES: cytidylyltransferase domain-containing protein [Vibrio]|uniref:acylneuraminate cytidylyltransferase family protein n=1 Tax=Vibrio TaxID=662 RepID=UPI00030A74D0|nr:MULTISPECIES: acylneuraminate cytidylyltransferase family protein [Vibrio]OEE90910.1 CMP-N-acetlyneuraminic acid synthetase [Vibrio crassostreae 9ZC77]PMI72829.1 CMP-N-acetlyneuraminic acid synthetase [Vibrio splendidus]PMK13580.1 CMP-N-acetlyneuraminic acid synthetase [Vibrio sp. 10N.261.54.E10]
MINTKKILAFIPARGGSKRLPRKNILPLAGKPLIGWSIEAAKDSKYINQIFISTDDQEIAEVAQSFGIDVPELRPSHLASDTASTADVLTYTLEKFGNNVDIVVLLQPTSPLRTAVHIDQALELFVKKQASSVVSVTPCEHPPTWSNTLPDDGSLGEFVRPEALKRSQDLEGFYRFNGAIYIFDVRKFLKCRDICYTNESFAYVMENKDSFDIDQQLDFDLAEFFINKRL